MLDNLYRNMVKWKWLIAFAVVAGIMLIPLNTGKSGKNKSSKVSQPEALQRTEITTGDGKFDNLSDIVLTDINGVKTPLVKKAVKRRTLLIYAAEWCPHCKKFLPVVQKFQEAEGRKYNIIVIFSGTSEKKAVEDYVKANKYTFDWYYDKDLSIAERLYIQAIPFPVRLEREDDQLFMKWYLLERENVSSISKAMAN